MSEHPKCAGCGGTHSPLEGDECLTCRTIRLAREPSKASNGNNSTAVEQSVTAQERVKPPIGEVLDELAGFVRRFVVMSPAQADAIALWIAHTHCFDAADQTPYLAISSAEKRSGKTRLLEILELLVGRPWFTGRVTAAVLARKVDAERADVAIG
jgi:hypothetical protein